jgi:hypothetical protein
MANFTATMIDNDTAAITQLATAAVTQLAISATAVVAGVTQSATVMIMSEGRTGAYTIVLNSEPEGDVTIRLTSSDTLSVSLSFSAVIVIVCGRLQLLVVKVSKGVTVAAVVSLLVNLMVK